MSATKEIRSKIKSVQNTQKITKAMQMVATSKMRKTQESMKAARPYAQKARSVIANISNINPYARNFSPFLRVSNDNEKVGIILITSDKGLCGGLNSNSIKLFLEKYRSFVKADVDVDVCTIGQKALVACKRLNMNVTSSAVALGDKPLMSKIIGPISDMLNKFKDNKLDEVYIVYSHFVNTMKQLPTCEKLLPLSHDEINSSNTSTIEYEYEPSAIDILNVLICRYVESVVYQCMADNMASEQAARMVAMKSATDNAGTAINNLKLIYNKSRQAIITKELSEIVAGSSAV